MRHSPSHTIKLSDLPSHKPTNFTYTLSDEQKNVCSMELGLNSIKSAGIHGKIAPSGTADWKVTLQLDAKVTQNCVITLDSVKTNINQSITKIYATQIPNITAEEVEIPHGENVEVAPEIVNLHSLLLEELSLALPLYPKKEGAQLGSIIHTEPGKTAMTDEEARPFSGLSKLRDSLTKKAHSYQKHR